MEMQNQIFQHVILPTQLYKWPEIPVRLVQLQWQLMQLTHRGNRLWQLLQLILIWIKGRIFL
jgi:hypothetical protein